MNDDPKWEGNPCFLSCGSRNHDVDLRRLRIWRRATSRRDRNANHARYFFKQPFQIAISVCHISFPTVDRRLLSISAVIGRTRKVYSLRESNCVD